MTNMKALMLAAALTFSAAATPAFAYHSDSYKNRHARDHAEHRQTHGNINRGHERAHAEGFYSRSEHRGYHRSLKNLHGDFHETHPNTRHGHNNWRRY